MPDLSFRKPGISVYNEVRLSVQKLVAYIRASSPHAACKPAQAGRQFRWKQITYVAFKGRQEKQGKAFIYQSKVGEAFYMYLYWLVVRGALAKHGMNSSHIVPGCC